MIKKLIKIIESIHWKIYGKRHLLKLLLDEADMVYDTWVLLGEKKSGYLYRRLDELSEEITKLRGWGKYRKKKE